jgi:hypothetical protein
MINDFNLDTAMYNRNVDAQMLASQLYRPHSMRLYRTTFLHKRSEVNADIVGDRSKWTWSIVNNVQGWTIARVSPKPSESDIQDALDAMELKAELRIQRAAMRTGRAY